MNVIAASNALSPDGIGARLRRAREHAGLSALQAAERLHVDTQAIEALEEERFDEFGAAVYVRGHLRHYAELVGESPAELQQLFAATGRGVSSPDLTRIPKLERVSTSRTLLAPGMAVVVSVALIGIVWWVGGALQRIAPGVESGSLQPPLPAAPSADATSPQNPAESASPPAPDQAAAPPGAHAPARTPRTAHAATAVPLLARAAAPKVSSGTPLAAAAVARKHDPVHAKARIADLKLNFSEDSWAEVYDAHGARLYYDVGSGGSSTAVSGVPPLRIVLGNPAGVALQLDGRPVSIPDGAERDVTVEFEVNRTGRASPARLAAAGGRGS